jgi:hypothetical protein
MVASANPVTLTVTISDEQLRAICRSHRIPTRHARNFAEMITTGKVMSKDFYRLLSEDRRYAAATDDVVLTLSEPFRHVLDWQW